MFGIQLEKSELNTILAHVGNALPVKPQRQALEGILIKSTTDRVLFHAQNEKGLWVEETAEVMCGEEGTAVVPGKTLIDACRKMQDGKISLSFDDRKCIVKSGKAKIALSLMDQGTYPGAKNEESDMIIVHAKSAEIKRALAAVVTCIAKNEDRPMLTGVNLTVKDGQMTMVGLDGFRLAHFCVDVDAEREAACTISAAPLNVLQKVLPDSEENCTFAFSKAKTVIRYQNCVISGMNLQGDFIDYHRIIPENAKTQTMIGKTALEEAIGRAQIVAREGKNALIRLRVAENGTTIAAKSEISESEEFVESQTFGQDDSLALNEAYLSSAIAAMGGESLVLGTNGSLNPMTITRPDQPGDLMLLLPVRTFD